MNYLEYLECFYLHIENINKKKYLKKFNRLFLLLLSLEVGTSKKMHVGGPGGWLVGCRI